MSKFKQTKSGVSICPFFTWQSEDVERIGHTEDDVNLVYCTHVDNEDDYEGNCNEKLCPLLKLT